MNRFSFARFLAVLRKEWIQISRDPLTLRMIIIIPMMQLLLYGIAINGNPKNLPTGLLSADHSRYERSIIAALQNTGEANGVPVLDRYELMRVWNNDRVLNLDATDRAERIRGETHVVVFVRLRQRPALVHLQEMHRDAEVLGRKVREPVGCCLVGRG